MNKLKLLILLIIFTGAVYLYLNYDVVNEYVRDEIRLPRLLLTVLTGMILGSVGFCFQLLLDNPLAEPYILGISSGAALSSILAGTAGLYLFMPLFGFGGALASMFLVYWLARQGGGFNMNRLLLAGIIIGMFISAIISLVMYLNQEDIGNIINVLMGNLGHIFSRAEWKIFKVTSVVSILLLAYLMLQGRRLAILSTGDMVAESLGIEVKEYRIKIFIISSILTGITVSFAGIIGFVGLIIPHIVRLVWRGYKPLSIFYAGFCGALFLLVCDFLAKHISAVELPTGIITSFIGCPLFIYLLWKK